MALDALEIELSARDNSLADALKQVVRLLNEIERNTNKAGKAQTDNAKKGSTAWGLVQRAIQRVKGSIKEIESAVNLAGKAMGALSRFASGAVNLLNEAAAEMSNVSELEDAMRMRGLDEGIERFEAFARAQQEVTAFADTITRDLGARILSATAGLENFDASELIRATRLAEDFMQRTGQSAEAAARLISRVYSGRDLSRALLTLLPTQIEYIESLEETGDAALVTSETLRVLEDAYGGAAEAISPLEQNMAHVQNKWMDFKQEVGSQLGEALIESGFFGEILNALDRLRDWLTDNSDVIAMRFLAMADAAESSIKVFEMVMGTLLEIVGNPSQGNSEQFKAAFESAEEAFPHLTHLIGESNTALGEYYDSVGNLRTRLESLRDKAFEDEPFYGQSAFFDPAPVYELNDQLDELARLEEVVARHGDNLSGSQRHLADSLGLLTRSTADYTAELMDMVDAAGIARTAIEELSLVQLDMHLLANAGGGSVFPRISEEEAQRLIDGDLSPPAVGEDDDDTRGPRGPSAEEIKEGEVRRQALEAQLYLQEIEQTAYDSRIANEKLFLEESLRINREFHEAKLEAAREHAEMLSNQKLEELEMKMAAEAEHAAMMSDAKQAEIDARQAGIDQMGSFAKASVGFLASVMGNKKQEYLVKGLGSVAESVAAFAGGDFVGGAGHAFAATKFFLASKEAGKKGGGGGGGGGGGSRKARPKPPDAKRVNDDSGRKGSLVININAPQERPERTGRTIARRLNRFAEFNTGEQLNSALIED